jgi:hypothetical protein
MLVTQNESLCFAARYFVEKALACLFGGWGVQGTDGRIKEFGICMEGNREEKGMRLIYAQGRLLHLCRIDRMADRMEVGN